ncbi:MAG: hypothetical protein EXR35_01350 [Limnohabitans sp.]|nr:hypothetical protein [Limnohabitans sp.]
MAKTEKTIEIIKTVLTLKNILWEELVNALNALMFLQLKNKGSRRKFHHEKLNITIILHERHPHHEVQACYIDDVRDVLEQFSLI